MKTELNRLIEESSPKLQYDHLVKRVLSNRDVLARILKETVSEVKELSPEDIAKCITDDPQIGGSPVLPGEKIRGLNTEDAVPREGTVYYDIFFRLRIPKNDEDIIILIDLEAQKNYYPGYPICSRGIFYCARMLSAQNGVEFQIPDYGNIKKVVSIWLCINPPKKIGNAAVRIFMKKEEVLGEIPIEKEAYDKLEVWQVCLDETEKSESLMINLLNLLLSATVSAADKKRLLACDYGIRMNIGYRQELEQMCNLSDNIEEQGMKQGLEQGLKQGRMQELFALVQEGLLPIETAAGRTGQSTAEFEEEMNRFLVNSHAC